MKENRDTRYHVVVIMIDYRTVGLRVGLEIHQQLDSPRKLFCNCVPKLVDREPDFTIVRYQRPTLSETGEIDPTVKKEFKKKRRIIYEMYREFCLYEIDEKPPENLDIYSLKTALLLARIFHMKVPDVLFVSRKQYLDGSVPSGFQRTILVGLDGWLELSNGKRIKINQICLEEDAARKIRESTSEVVFRVDRLGIPLVEITTAAELENPDEVMDCALRIGAILRATRRVRRGLGTIRQDINVSIKGGARVEIKGVQYPEWFKPLIDNEIIRQNNLIEIAKELQNRGLTREEILKEKPIDVTNIFRNTKAKFIQKAIKRGEKAYALRLPKFGGILGREIQPGRRFGKEFAERVKVIVGLAGIIHTDELPAYGISVDEKNNLFKLTGADPDKDCVVFVVGPTDRVIDALEEVKERAVMALAGPPEETRRANPDGTTSFERPLGGAGRLYPDTDTPPIEVTEQILEEVNKMKFEYPWDTVKRLVTNYNLQREVAERIVLSPQYELFEIAVDVGVSPKTVIKTFEILTSLRREGLRVDELSDEVIIDVFKALKEGKISKEALSDILELLAKKPGLTVDQAISKLGLEKVSEEDVRMYIKELIKQKIDLIKERRERAFKPLMGLVMAKFRGRIDGKIIAQILEKELSNVIREIE